MERLISDANKLPGVLKDGNDLSVDSFSDVVEAISRVQKEMGISGTTADEAAKTIEGSVGAMKAAWQNWLAGLGNENADMGALSQQLAESIGTALKNIVPRIGAIARGRRLCDTLTVQQSRGSPTGTVPESGGCRRKRVQEPRQCHCSSTRCVHSAGNGRHRAFAL